MLFPYNPLVAFLAIAGMVFVPDAFTQDPAPGKSQPGWSDAFVELFGYQKILKKPVYVEGSMLPPYRQTAVYVWMGGRAEEIDVTLARNLTFKTAHADDVLKKDPNRPESLQIGGKKVWHWTNPNAADNLDEVAEKLVVVLDADKAIIIEQRGQGGSLQDIAKLFDFAKIEKALAKPPAP